MTQKLPQIFQTEATECGLACLAMIANYHGHQVDLNGLRQDFDVSMMGVRLSDIIVAAEQLDLGSRPLRLEMEDFSNLQLPAILHWDLDHFVVLKKVSGNKVHIHDPALGARILSFKTVSDHFTGVALELTPLASFSSQTRARKMRIWDLWGKLLGWKRALFQLLILSIILQVLVLAAPFYLQLAVDQGIANNDDQFLLVIALAFGAFAVLQVLTRLVRDLSILHFGYQMSFQMVSNLFRHLMHLPAGFFEKRHMGDILSRIRSTTPIQTAMTQTVVATIIDGIMAVVTGIVIFLYSPFLALIVLVSVLLLLLIAVVFYPVLRRAQEEMIIKEAHENTHKIESIRASTAIKLFSAQAPRLSTWRNLYADYVNASLKYGKYGVYQQALQNAIVLIQAVIIIYFGAKLILSDSSAFTIGMLFAFLAYRQSFTDSVVSLFNKYIEFRLLGLHLDRIADIVQSETESTSTAKTGLDCQALEGDIEINGLSFRYSPNDPYILKDFDLQIKSGEFVALTGRSGGGKTTLLKLILGLYEPEAGEILIGGQTLTPVLHQAWRQQTGVVMQDDALLSGTIAENISFFDPQIDMAKVEEAARLAQIHEEITAMPMSYLSMIGDMGSVLSGGQKQRVLLARALYKNPKILFLDEGTANLDRETEKIIVDVVEAMDMTRIIVAHREEFLKRVDKTVEI